MIEVKNGNTVYYLNPQNITAVYLYSSTVHISLIGWEVGLEIPYKTKKEANKEVERIIHDMDDHLKYFKVEKTEQNLD